MISSRIDTIFSEHVNDKKAQGISLFFESKSFSIERGSTGWPLLQYNEDYQQQKTLVRDIWIKPDCILREEIDNKEEAIGALIVIEVCKTWQNFMAKRILYAASCLRHAQQLVLTWEDKDRRSIRPTSVDVVYALPTDGNDWLLSHIVNMPDCGGRFCGGIEKWQSAKDVSLDKMVNKAMNREALKVEAQNRNPSQRGKSRNRNKSNPVGSILPCVMA
jgi:hypothetical protein